MSIETQLTEVATELRGLTALINQEVLARHADHDSLIRLQEQLIPLPDKIQEAVDRMTALEKRHSKEREDCLLLKASQERLRSDYEKHQIESNRRAQEHARTWKEIFLRIFEVLFTASVGSMVTYAIMKGIH